MVPSKRAKTTVFDLFPETGSDPRGPPLDGGGGGSSGSLTRRTGVGGGPWPRRGSPLSAIVSMSPGGGAPRDRRGGDHAGDPSGGTFMMTCDSIIMITSSCYEIISISVRKSRTGGCGGDRVRVHILFYVIVYVLYSVNKENKV